MLGDIPPPLPPNPPKVDTKLDTEFTAAPTAPIAFVTLDNPGTAEPTALKIPPRPPNPLDAKLLP